MSRGELVQKLAQIVDIPNTRTSAQVQDIASEIIQIIL